MRRSQSDVDQTVANLHQQFYSYQELLVPVFEALLTVAHIHTIAVPASCTGLLYSTDVLCVFFLSSIRAACSRRTIGSASKF